MSIGQYAGAIAFTLDRLELMNREGRTDILVENKTLSVFGSSSTILFFFIGGGGSFTRFDVQQHWVAMADFLGWSIAAIEPPSEEEENLYKKAWSAVREEFPSSRIMMGGSSSGGSFALAGLKNGDFPGAEALILDSPVVCPRTYAEEAREDPKSCFREIEPGDTGDDCFQDFTPSIPSFVSYMVDDPLVPPQQMEGWGFREDSDHVLCSSRWAVHGHAFASRACFPKLASWLSGIGEEASLVSLMWIFLPALLRIDIGSIASLFLPDSFCDAFCNPYITDTETRELC